jgi:hypothetical protein
LLVQDAANRSGGKWIIRLKKVVSGRFWEDLVLLYPTLHVGCGDSFQCQDYIITALPKETILKDVFVVAQLLNRTLQKLQVGLFPVDV